MTEETKLFIHESEIPAPCSECLMFYDYMNCIITGENIWDEQRKYQVFNEEEERLPNCPLRSLEPLYERGYIDGANNAKMALDSVIRDDWDE